MRCCYAWVLVRVAFLGGLFQEWSGRGPEAALLVRAAHRAGHLVGTGQAADAERHLLLHHQELPLLPHCRQGVAGQSGCSRISASFALSLRLFVIALCHAATHCGLDILIQAAYLSTMLLT